MEETVKHNKDRNVQRLVAWTYGEVIMFRYFEDDVSDENADLAKFHKWQSTLRSSFMVETFH
jgi:hypothetical protein